MAFASGVFNRLYSWVSDRDASIKITASRMDAEFDGIATGLSSCLLKDGSQTVTANIPMATYKFTGLGAGTGAGDSVRYEQVVLLSAGAEQIITRSAAGTVLKLASTDAGADSGPDLVLHRNSASPADSDTLGSILFTGEDDGGAETTYARIRPVADDVTNSTEDGSLYLSVMSAGTLTDKVRLKSDTLAPSSADGITLGTQSLPWSDLFLASGGVINFDSANYTVTHTAGILTFSGVIAAASTIEVGHATDTTISRLAAGQIGVEGNAICRIKTGTYTGDGATSLAVTGVGFTPKYVKIWPRETTPSTTGMEVIETTDTIVDDNAAGGAFNYLGALGAVTFAANAIIALGADGFTVDDGGADSHPNKSAQVYNYLCLG